MTQAAAPPAKTAGPRLDRARVLVVDDEPKQVAILQTILAGEGYDVETARTGEAALASIQDSAPSVLLTDLKLPGLDGIALLAHAAKISPETSVLIMTAHGTIDTAVEAMKRGAFDYLTKPLERDTVVLAVERAAEKARLLRENVALREQLVDRFSLANIIGDHGSMQDVFRMVLKAAPSGATVLIHGESGTGKELIARAIHYNSPRAAEPFYGLNCAAIPEPLLESELFGHEKGAFTGAAARKIGLFETASGSTLFLDEVGDMPVGTQAKLLRALQEREIRRVGGNASIPFDARIVAATNKDLAALMREGSFREDLYYRLHVVSIVLPPLRERITDVPRLASFFLAKHAARAGRAAPALERRALAALMAYRWPGNVRQLESVLESALLMTEAATIELRDLPQEIRQQGPAGAVRFDLPESGISFEGLERALLGQALARGGNVSKAARLLGMTRRTFQYRLKKFGLGFSADRAGDEEAAPDGAPPAPDGRGPKSGPS